MTVSGSVNFSMTAEQIVSDARSLLGIDAEEEPLQATELSTGLKALNLMLKAWQADEEMEWTYTQGTVTLVSGTASYVFGAGGTFTSVPFAINDDAYITRGGSDLPMIRLSREEYRAIPRKDSTGYPTQWYYDRQRSGGTLYVWPSPDTTAGVFNFTYRRIVNDLDAAADTLDLPQEWHEAVIYNLAVRLIPRYSVIGDAEARLVTSQAAEFYGKLKGFDIGEGKGSISILPADSRGR